MLFAGIGNIFIEIRSTEDFHIFLYTLMFMSLELPQLQPKF